MPEMMNRKYIENHLGVHNYESFGRAIVATVLEEALNQMADQDGGFEGELKMELESSVEATGTGCIWTTMIVNGRRIRIHTTPITPTPHAEF